GVAVEFRIAELCFLLKKRTLKATNAIKRSAEKIYFSIEERILKTHFSFKETTGKPGIGAAFQFFKISIAIEAAISKIQYAVHYSASEIYITIESATVKKHLLPEGGVAVSSFLLQPCDNRFLK